MYSWGSIDLRLVPAKDVSPSTWSVTDFLCNCNNILKAMMDLLPWFIFAEWVQIKKKSNYA